MKKDLFESIVCDFKNLLKCLGVNQMKIIINELCRKYSSIDYSTMYGLINYEYRKEKNDTKINQIDHILQEWNNGITILQLAQKYNICAYGLLRHLLIQVTKSKEITKKWLKNPNFCDNGKLAVEIMQVNLHDIFNGIFHNQLSLNGGIAFENQTRTTLEENRISFMCEEELREKNYDVTPDFRLNLPLLLVQQPSSTSTNMTLYRYNDKNDALIDQLKNDPHIEPIIITWIECKAFFASVECHIEYYQNQYYSYINRFGNGMVLYKYGFVEDIPDCYKQNLVLVQQMPPFG